jgi:hypothetical protein
MVGWASVQTQHTQGEWWYGQRHGKGTLLYSDGAAYEGMWRFDVKHGAGKQTWPGGEWFFGEWADDKQQGEGIYKFADGVFMLFALLPSLCSLS